MSTVPTSPGKPMTIQASAHPDDFSNIISGIMAGLQVFTVVEPFILQLIAIEKGQPASISVTPKS